METTQICQLMHRCDLHQDQGPGHLATWRPGDVQQDQGPSVHLRPCHPSTIAGVEPANTLQSYSPQPSRPPAPQPPNLFCGMCSLISEKRQKMQKISYWRDRKSGRQNRSVSWEAAKIWEDREPVCSRIRSSAWWYFSIFLFGSVFLNTNLFH